MRKMVERVSIAIQEEAEEKGTVFTANEAHAIAIAAIWAMREPTAEMCDVGRKFLAEAWQAMIDGAFQ